MDGSQKYLYIPKVIVHFPPVSELRILALTLILKCITEFSLIKIFQGIDAADYTQDI